MLGLLCRVSRLCCMSASHPPRLHENRVPKPAVAMTGRMPRARGMGAVESSHVLVGANLLEAFLQVKPKPVPHRVEPPPHPATLLLLLLPVYPM